jgi:RHS repeat-associated protein
MPAGASTVTVKATDASGNTRTQEYEMVVVGTAASFECDANGNLTSKTEGGSTWTYEWDALNQLTRVSKDGAEVARFDYDPLGRRVRKVAGGVTYSYLYAGMDILRETRSDGSTATTHTYVHGPGIDEPLARVDGSGTPAYYHADGLGSIVKLTVSTGAVIQTWQYDPWGNPEIGANEPGYALTGREWDPEIGLYYYRARYYDPKAGRFISEDPIGFLGGVNFYTYVDDNPPNWMDAQGLEVNKNFFRKGTEGYRAAQHFTFPGDPFYTIAGHGGSRSFYPLDDRDPKRRARQMPVEELADLIRNDPNWKGRPIRLMICHVGKGTYAEELSRKLSPDQPLLVEATEDRIYWQDNPNFAPDYNVSYTTGKAVIYNPFGTTR